MNDGGQSLWIVFGVRVAATFVGLLGAFIVRRFWNKIAKEYDRSMLIRLGTGPDSMDYANVPLIVGRFPFSDLGGQVRSNLDARDVVGFVIGTPKWLGCRDLRCLPIKFDPKFHKPGYYAYCVVQWEHAAMVKRFADQWLHIRRTGYNGGRAERGMREHTFIGFGTDSQPDAGTGDVPMIANLSSGFRASVRYQPYLRGGFKAEDIKMRALAPQTRLLIKIKNLFTKRRRNA